MSAPPAEALAETVAFLSDPASYGDPAARVERVETHGSILFLVGERAFKLKKPVSFGYMDFSTLDRRKANAEAELALNRRTAPDLYLGLSAVTRAADGRLALDGAGTPVEWLVRMRRFDRDQQLDRLAAAGRLDRAAIAAFADAIAALHGAAARRPDCGGADEFARLIADNDAELRRHPALLAPERVATLTARSRDALRRHATLLDRRRDQGEVRHCHGDLHLGNACRIDGRIVLFDALEFSERLAVTDVLYDLAFPLMDLWRLGLRAEANHLFNRYAERLAPAAFDAFLAGLALLPLFLATRAAVRAHVSAAGAAPDQAAAYLARALDFLAPAPARLAAVGGLSGAGKSTLAAGLAPHIAPPPGALVLRTDVLRKAAAGVAAETRLPAGAYSEAASARVYRRMLECADTALGAGQAVVLDAVFAHPDERRRAGDLARRAGVAFHGFWLEAPHATMRDRIAGRQGDASDATPAVLDRQSTYDLGAIGWTRIDASGPEAATLAGVLAAWTNNAAKMPPGRAAGGGCWMFRSILVPLVGPLLRPEALDAALALARRFEACVDAFHPALDPAASAAYLGEGTTGALIETVVEAAETESERRMEAARAFFEARVGQAGLPEERVRFVTERGRDTDLIAARARVSDLTVLSAGGVRGDPSLAAIWEALLYESGRPVLLMPEEAAPASLGAPGTVLIAWNESAEAARAVASAVPLWSVAPRVVAVPIAGHKLDGLVAFGARHGATIEPRALPKIERGVLEDGRGEAILQVADEIGAAMIVMGAYTHGRLRRFIMGGATKTVVENTTIPAFMAH